MTLTGPALVRLLKKSAVYLLFFPAALAGVVWHLTGELPREYISNATLYTGIASGYSITSTGNDRPDHITINNAFDNLIATIKSRETIGEVGLRLLARHLSLKAPKSEELGAAAFRNVQALVDNTLRKAIVRGNEGATFERLRALASRPGDNTVKYLLYQSKSYYAVESILGKLTVARRNNSDMLELSFKSDDPAVCQHTLQFLIEVFTRRYNSFKFSETNNVVAFFEEEARKSVGHLRGAEDQLTRYEVNNKIINYDEQSKYVASSKENTTSEYVKEKMALDAARSARTELEKKLDEQGSVLMANGELSARRSELAKAQSQYANATVYGYPPDQVEALRATVNRLSDDLKVAVRKYYNSTVTLGSVPQRELMDRYVSDAIRYQESAARVAVLEQRMREFDQIYTEMAPLGSSVNRLEREIGVAEREYLSILHGLNMARLRQKNLEMSGTLTILDPPLLPMKPQPSIRKLLVIAAYAAGWVLVLAVAFARLLLSRKIATPERAAQLTVLDLVAAFPLFRRKFRRFDLAYAEQCALEQLRAAVLLETAQPNAPHAPCRLVVLFGSRPGGGKTWVGERLSHQFARAGHRVCYAYPDDTARGEAETSAEVLPYPVQWDFADTQQIGVFLQLLPHQTAADFDYIFLELPNLRETAPPVRLIGQADLSLLVLAADHPWTTADEGVLRRYRQAAQRPVRLVLNRVEPDRLAGLLDAVPNRRSRKKASPQPEPTPEPA